MIIYAVQGGLSAAEILGLNRNTLRKKLAQLTKSELHLNIVEVRKPELDAALVGRAEEGDTPRRPGVLRYRSSSPSLDLPAVDPLAGQRQGGAIDERFFVRLGGRFETATLLAVLPAPPLTEASPSWQGELRQHVQ